MTSKQVMLTVAAAFAMLLGSSGCYLAPKQGADPLISPYTETHVFAVVPLRNESGSLQVDGAAIADQLSRQLENASNIDVVPVNRVLAAMDALKMKRVATPGDAMKLLATLQVDALVIGTVTTYDPYDPPKIGMAIELYTNTKNESMTETDVRGITRAATDTDPLPTTHKQKQPVSIVSAYFDAADPEVRRKIARYAYRRRVQNDPDFIFQKDDEEPERMYRISMDLYSEFASYVMSWRLLKAERERLGPPPTADKSAH